MVLFYQTIVLFLNLFVSDRVHFGLQKPFRVSHKILNVDFSVQLKAGFFPSKIRQIVFAFFEKFTQLAVGWFSGDFVHEIADRNRNHFALNTFGSPSVQ